MKRNALHLLKILLLVLPAANLMAQNCTTNTDLLSIPGSLQDHTKTPIGGGTFSAIERPVGMKILIAVENLCKKKFVLKGGEAKSWFHIKESGKLDLYKHQEYQYKIGFYQYACVNGSKLNSSEYTVDFTINANTPFKEMLRMPDRYNEVFFYEDNKKYGSSYISLFRYFILKDTEAHKISSGNGYTVNHQGNNFAAHTDVYYNWYITKPGTQLLSVVTRKEYLNSLLEFYQRENDFLSANYTAKLAEAKRYMEQYEKSGNKAMYNSHKENKEQFEIKLRELASVIHLKKQRVEQVLQTESSSWLQTAATLDPGNYDCFNKPTKDCFNFNSFYTGPQAETVYKWNPELVKQSANQPAKPLFFKVQFRFKAGEVFSDAIMNTYVEKFDFDGLRKMLND